MLRGHFPDPARAESSPQTKPSEGRRAAGGEQRWRVVPSLWKEPPQNLRHHHKLEHLLTSSGFLEYNFSNYTLRMHLFKAQS